MRVLWLNGNPNPNFGGTEIHTVQMIKELLKEGVDILLVCAKDSYVDKHTLEIEKFYLSFPHSLALVSTIKLLSLVKRLKPDFLVANNGKEYPNAVIAGKLGGTRVVLFRHMERMKQRIVRKIIFPQVDLFLAVSEHVKKNLIEEGVREDKIKVIYNVVDEERFFYREKSPKSVELLFVGKLEEGKGVMDFLMAFDSLLNTEKDLKAWIVGDGKLRECIKSYINERGIHEHVSVVGYVSDVEEYYKRSHICVIPSKETEAFPRVAIEALACGCALVVSDVGGIKEAVEEGRNGYVFKAGNLTDLAKKLKKAVNHWREMSQNSLKVYKKKFSRDSVINNFMESLENLRR